MGALEKTDGKPTQTARLLRITGKTLRYKMKKFDLREGRHVLWCT